MTDYVQSHARLQPFYRFAPDEAGMAAALRHRLDDPIDRPLLVNALHRQYAAILAPDAVRRHIDLLAQPTTFAICTAHQPNLLTGYLYFTYKILHAIRLADWCKQRFPDCDFVPVYYMGSEDNDLEELGAFRYEGRPFVWDAAGQQGAVGRMNTDSLRPLFQDLFRYLGPPGDHLDALKRLIHEAYLQHPTIAAATQYLVNELFGRYGLVTIDPDDAALKRAFVPIMEQELTRQQAMPTVLETSSQLAARYKVQASPRQINLFYLENNLRERIEHNAARWHVLNTPIVWDKAAMLRELHDHPERFSPNVILRPLFQETILPNVAFIGGGAEVAYWLQLLDLFDHHQVFFPSIHLRQSLLIANARQRQQRLRLRLTAEALFADEAALMRHLLLAHGHTDWQTGEEALQIEQAMNALREKAARIDPTLRAAADAALAKMQRQRAVLQQKMQRAEKRKLDTEARQALRLRNELFPNGKLQERTESFMPFYLEHGPAFFDQVLKHMQPMRHQFLLLEGQ